MPFIDFLKKITCYVIIFSLYVLVCSAIRISFKFFQKVPLVCRSVFIILKNIKTESVPRALGGSQNLKSPKVLLPIV